MASNSSNYDEQILHVGDLHRILISRLRAAANYKEIESPVSGEPSPQQEMVVVTPEDLYQILESQIPHATEEQLNSYVNDLSDYLDQLEADLTTMDGGDLYRLLISYLRRNAAANYDEIESSVSGQPAMAVITQKDVCEILESHIPRATEDQLNSYVNDLGDYLDQLEADLTANDGEDLYGILISHLRDNAAASYDEIESSVSGLGMAVLTQNDLYEILKSQLPHATEDQLNSYVLDLGDYLDQLEADLTAMDGEDLYRILKSYLRHNAAANYDEIESSISGQPSAQQGMAVITQKDLYEILESHIPHITENQLNCYVNVLGDYLDQLEADLAKMGGEDLYRIFMSHLRHNAAANYDEIESSQPSPQQGMAIITQKDLYEILESQIPRATENQLNSYVNVLGDYLNQLEADLTAKDGEDLYRILTSHLRDNAAANYDEIESSVSGLGMAVITEKDLYEILESRLPHATEDQLNSYVNDLGYYLDQLGADLTPMERDGLKKFFYRLRSRTFQDGDFQDNCMVCQSKYERKVTL